MSELKLDNTFGVTLIGVIVAAALWGVSCVQVWYYYNHYPKDAWHNKLLVAAGWMSDTVHQMLISHTIYTYLVTNFGNPVELGNLVWSLLVEILFNGLTTLMVQCFFTVRVWRLSGGSYFLTGLVSILVVGQFGWMLYYTIKSLQFQNFAQLRTLKVASITVNALAAAGDVLIATILCSILQMSRTGFKRSDTMIKKLILFSMSTGLVTSICAVAALISTVSAPSTFIYIFFYFNIGRLYSNSLMVALNARKNIRGAGGDEPMTISLSDIQDSSLTANSKRTSNIAIMVDTTREYMRDQDSNPKRPEDFMDDCKVDHIGVELNRQTSSQLV